MKDRIKQIRKAEGLTQAEFAKKLNLSRNFVNLVENGSREASGRTISDITRCFGYSEKWIKTGEGDMYEPKTKEEEVAELVGRTLNGSNDLKLAVIRMICSRTDEELKVIESALRAIVNDIKKDTAD